MIKVLGAINLGENEIEIKVIENEGIKTIEIINAKDCNIVYDGKTILENTKTELFSIPVQIRDAVKQYSEYVEINKDDSNFTDFYMYISGIEYYCQVETIIVNEEKSFLTMKNWLNNYKKISENNEKLATSKNSDKYEKKLKDLKNTAKEKGYEFDYSHEGDTYDECYYLKIPIKGFDLENIKSFLSLWDKYNKELNKYIA